ncbi:hypothetical protein C8R44DRAFT_880468 [Mycena epipterygia]|nr:hypothetical protein C8R44DRAFT_880468 [Mycena epipterygia]
MMPLFAPPPIPSHQFPLHTQATVSELPTRDVAEFQFPLLLREVWAYPPPPPPPLPAPAAPAPAPSPLAGVNTAVLALMSAVDAASVALDAVSGSPLTLLAEHLADVSAALENVNAASAIVCAAVSLALPPGKFFFLLTRAPLLILVPPVSTPRSQPAFVRMTGPWVAGTLYGVVPAAPLAAVPDNNEKWFAITRIKSGLAEKCPSQGAALEHFNEALACGSISVVL